jgi:cellulose synthase/poly-beta-1,6-N-acetylglucosamine synthase-like glycosyltransferase
MSFNPSNLEAIRQARQPLPPGVPPFGSARSALRWRGRTGGVNLVFTLSISLLYGLFALYCVLFIFWWVGSAPGEPAYEELKTLADWLKLILTLGMLLYIPYLPYRLSLLEKALHPHNGFRKPKPNPPTLYSPQPLPRYVVLVPVYREASTAPNLVENMVRLLDYDPLRGQSLFQIEVAFLVENDDYTKLTHSTDSHRAPSPSLRRSWRGWHKRLPYWGIRLLFFVVGLPLKAVWLALNILLRIVGYVVVAIGLGDSMARAGGSRAFGNPSDEDESKVMYDRYSRKRTSAPDDDKGTGSALKEAIEALIVEAEAQGDTQRANTLRKRFRILVLPPPKDSVKLKFRQDVSEPKTKPRALNFGLYETFSINAGNQAARLVVPQGSLEREFSCHDATYCVVFDAEDRPEPDQLVKAYHKFTDPDPEYQNVMCWQAQLSYENLNDNWIISLFKADYSSWYELVLPGLDEMGHVIPLGGTSNHFKVETLKAIGSWDAFNVTEDADLGIWIYRAGGRVKVLDSITWEEANFDTEKWIKQRSRWIKGYIQTFVAHCSTFFQMRHDLNQGQDKDRIWGRGVFLLLTLTASSLLPLLSPIYWTMMLIYVVSLIGYAAGIGEFKAGLLFVTSINSTSFLPWGTGAFFIGNMIYFLMLLLGAYRHRKPGSMRFIVAWWPLYWILMSIAAIRAFQEYVGNPFTWDKSDHSLLRNN